MRLARNFTYGAVWSLSSFGPGAWHGLVERARFELVQFWLVCLGHSTELYKSGAKSSGLDEMHVADHFR